MIRLQAVWLATEPMDMRAGVDRILARVVEVFGAARPHHGYVFANRSATRLKVLVHDGIGVWLCMRRLYRSSFVWSTGPEPRVSMTRAQLDALVLGLPWHRIGDAGVITTL